MVFVASLLHATSLNIYAMDELTVSIHHSNPIKIYNYIQNHKLCCAFMPRVFFFKFDKCSLCFEIAFVA